jgi:hypothetical protein
MAFLHLERWPLEASVRDLMQAEVISVAEDQDQETITAVTCIPTLQSIAPYRQALVVYAYEIVQVHEGTDPGPRILVHHWALHNGRIVAPGTRVGDTVRLAVEPFDAHPDLQGERVIQDMEDPEGLMFYEPLKSGLHIEKLLYSLFSLALGSCWGCGWGWFMCL